MGLFSFKVLNVLTTWIPKNGGDSLVEDYEEVLMEIRRWASGEWCSRRLWPPIWKMYSTSTFHMCQSFPFCTRERIEITIQRVSLDEWTGKIYNVKLETIDGKFEEDKVNMVKQDGSV